MASFARRLTSAARPSKATKVGTGQSWLLNILSGGRSSSGINVTSETAIRQTTVWRCVSLLSWISAYLPLKVYRAKDGGGAEVARDHPNHRLLAQAPNDWQTSFQRRQFATTCLLLRGNSFEILQWKAGTLQAIIPVHPDRVSVYVDESANPIYKVKLYPSNEEVWLSRFEIMHNWLFSADGYVGLSPIEQCKDAIGLALGAEQYGGSLMANAAVVSGVLSLPPEIYSNPEAKAAAKLSWEEAHQGIGKAGKVTVLPATVKFEPLSMKSTDAQWIEMRNLQVEEVCRIYGVPPALAQHMTPTSSWGAGEVARYQGFLATTIDPMLVAGEQVMQRSLFLPDDFDVVYPQYNRAALLRTDLLTRYRAYAIGRQWGWLTVNKVLDLEEMNPVGSEGDVLLDPVNMTRIPIDPTALLGGGDGNGAGSAELAERVAALLKSGNRAASPATQGDQNA